MGSQYIYNLRPLKELIVSNLNQMKYNKGGKVGIAENIKKNVIKGSLPRDHEAQNKDHNKKRPKGPDKK